MFKPKIALINIIFILLFLTGCEDNTPAQKSTKVKHKEKVSEHDEHTFVKDTLYILWQPQKIPYENPMMMDPDNKEEEYYDNEPYYSEEDKGLVFELLEDLYLMFEDGSVSDKLKTKNLYAYQIHTITEIDSLDAQWRKKNELALTLYPHGMWYYVPYHYDRNTMYVTYLLKIDNDGKTFTIYPVSWYTPPEYEF